MKYNILKTFSIWICWYDLGKNCPWLWPNSWSYIRLLIPYQWRFYECWELHDLHYCQWIYETDREYADRIFYEWCLIKSNNYLQKSFVLLYYKLVSKYWYNYFNYNK